MLRSNVSTDDTSEGQAVRLAMAIGRLRCRLRDQARASLGGRSLTQLTLLKRLHRDGPATAAALAAAEYVSPQAIAQNVALLKADGLVETKPDPGDRRKTLVQVTPAGHHLVESALASREAWLVQAIDAVTSPEERDDVERAIALLERLADVRTERLRGLRNAGARPDELRPTN